MHIFIDGEFKATEKFFHHEVIARDKIYTNKISESNALIIYGLSPGAVTRIKDVEVCIERCKSVK